MVQQREKGERERRAQEGSENCVYFKGEVERKALNCEQLQRGGERRGGGPKGRGCWLIKGMWLAWDSVTGILR